MTYKTKEEIGADHEKLAMGEIDDLKDAENHGKAGRNEGVGNPEGQAVDDLLNDHHGKKSI